MRRVFNVGQRTAVVGAFKLAGYQGDLHVSRHSDGTALVRLLHRVWCQRDHRRLRAAIRDEVLLF